MIIAEERADENSMGDSHANWSVESDIKLAEGREIDRRRLIPRIHFASSGTKLF